MLLGHVEKNLHIYFWIVLSSWWPNEFFAIMKFTSIEFLLLQLSHPYSLALKLKVNYYLGVSFKRGIYYMLFSMSHYLAAKQHKLPLLFFFLLKTQIADYPIDGADPSFCGVTHSLFIRYCNRLVVLPVWSPKQIQLLYFCRIILPKRAE